MGVGAILPMILLSSAKVRHNPKGLFAGALMIVLGFILNRMNITITGMESYAGQRYFPHWMELSVTRAIVTLGFIAFSFAAKYLQIFGHEHEEAVVEAKPLPEVWAEELTLVSQRY